jgi:hypothetical protein
VTSTTQHVGRIPSTSRQLRAWSFGTLLIAGCVALPIACGGDVDENETKGGPTDATLPDASPVPDGQATDATTDAASNDGGATTDGGHRCSQLGEARGSAVTVVPAALGVVSFAVADACSVYAATPGSLLACDYAGCTAAARVVVTSTAASSGMPLPENATPGDFFPPNSPRLSQVVANGSDVHVLVDRDFSRPYNGGVAQGRLFNSRRVDPRGFPSAWDGVSALAGFGLGPISLHQENGEITRNGSTYQGSPGVGTIFLDVTGAIPLLPADWEGAYLSRGRRPRSVDEAYLRFRAGGPRPPAAGLARATWAPSGGDAGGDAGGRVPRFSFADPPAGSTAAEWLSTLSDVLPLPNELLLVRNGSSLSRCAYPASSAPATTLCHDETTITTRTASGYEGSWRTYLAHAGIYQWVSPVGDGGAATYQLAFCSETDLVANACVWTPIGPSFRYGAEVVAHDADHVYVMTSASADGLREVVRIAK